MGKYSGEQSFKVETSLEGRVLISILLILLLFILHERVVPRLGSEISGYASVAVLGFLVYVLGVTYYFVRNVGKSLHSLATFMSAVAGGNLDAELNLNHKDSFLNRLFAITDVRILEESSIKMKENLARMIDELKKKE